MENIYKEVLRKKLLNHRYAEIFDFFRVDLEEKKRLDWSYDLMILFIEDKLGAKVENRTSFIVSLSKKFRRWKGGRPHNRKPPSPKAKDEIPNFHYNPSMEPKKKGIFEQLEEQIKLREQEKKNKPQASNHF